MSSSGLPAGDLKLGVTVAGITGSFAGPTPACSADGETGCVATASFKAADLNNLSAGNIKDGVTLAGTLGTYPSVTTPLTNATGTTDLTSLAAATPAGALARPRDVVLNPA